MKWHKLRRRWSDPPFLRKNLMSGLKAGAALEIDLVTTADGHFVCLHELTLDEETSGSGPVAAATRAEIADLKQRGRDGTVVDAPPLFLDEVVEAVAAHRQSGAPRLQLDLKERSDRFGDRGIDRLHATLGEHAGAFIVSSTDWSQLARLAALHADLARGFDPQDLWEVTRPTSLAEFQKLASRTLALAPGAQVYYLQADLVLDALRADLNLIERVAINGAEVDVWTLDADRPSLREELLVLAAAGCHQITTNDAEVLEPMLRELL